MTAKSLYVVGKTDRQLETVMKDVNEEKISFELILENNEHGS